MSDYRTLLITELEKRKKINPQFSMRAFARVLNMSPSNLSLLMNGKKILNRKQMVKIADKLNLGPLDAQRILGSTLHAADRDVVSPTQLLNDDEFRLIADWYHFAILSLGLLKGNKATGKWISEQLGISQIQALDAFERLKRLGFIELQGAGFRQSSKPLSTTNDVPSSAIRHFHKQTLDLAKEKLESVPIERRDFSAVIMAVNFKNMNKFKKLVSEFKQQASELLEIADPSDVYTLSIQLFPVTQSQQGVKK